MATLGEQLIGEGEGELGEGVVLQVGYLCKSINPQKTYTVSSAKRILLWQMAIQTFKCFVELG